MKAKIIYFSIKKEMCLFVKRFAYKFIFLKYNIKIINSVLDIDMEFSALRKLKFTQEIILDLRNLFYCTNLKNVI